MAVLPFRDFGDVRGEMDRVFAGTPLCRAPISTMPTTRTNAWPAPCV